MTVKIATVGDQLRRTLAPQNLTFWGYGPMNSTMWFQFNISSSSSSGVPAPVKVTVSVVRQSAGGPTKIPFWGPFRENSFNQKVSTAGGTYIIDIENENLFPVTLDGNVLVQLTKEKYRTIYPYIILGFPIMLGGTGALIYGIFKKPPKSKRKMVKKIKR